MTAAEELTAAADKLGALADAATKGPWVEAGIGDYGWSVIAEDHGHSFGIETEDSEQGKADAAYIATMHPEVGRTLAYALRIQGRVAQLRADRGADVDRATRNLLRVARLINGGAS